jgi:hypothetical protein
LQDYMLKLPATSFREVYRVVLCSCRHEMLNDDLNCV